MEAVIFVGIQATGKSEFYRQRFFGSHVRISLDMLRTRNRERLLLAACLESGQPFVVDNTNPSAQDRARYVSAATDAGFRVVGYYFRSSIHEAIERNRRRSGAERVPDKGVLGTYARLELPSRDEGFDELYFVAIHDDGFVVEDYDENL
ncbi:MAG: AAA family ATPase [Micrococcales bacterium]|nr:AAA family ATPase [Micrococcales bacterium]